eukprot:jgi/Mesvir1/23305/Mv21001-RA.1
MAITTRSMASMRRRASRSDAKSCKPLPKVRAPVKNCKRRCCDKPLPAVPPPVVSDSESAELLENDGECKYPDADILPKYQDTAPFDILHAELANYPCDKCGKRSPRGFYLRHNDALSRNGLDDCWCEQCMVEVVAPFAYTDRDYLARFMDQWTRVEPRRENGPPFVSKRADQLQYACCMCEHVPEKVAYRVKEDESIGTKPGIYCEPCANREIVYLVRRASEFETLGAYWTREQLAAKGEEVAKRFERDPELSKICASIAPYFNTSFYSHRLYVMKCSRKTKAGTSCKNKARTGLKTCASHAAASKKKRHAARAFEAPDYDPYYVVPHDRAEYLPPKQFSGGAVRRNRSGAKKYRPYPPTQFKSQPWYDPAGPFSSHEPPTYESG